MTQNSNHQELFEILDLEPIQIPDYAIPKIESVILDLKHRNKEYIKLLIKILKNLDIHYEELIKNKINETTDLVDILKFILMGSEHFHKLDRLFPLLKGDQYKNNIGEIHSILLDNSWSNKAKIFLKNLSSKVIQIEEFTFNSILGVTNKLYVSLVTIGLYLYYEELKDNNLNKGVSHQLGTINKHSESESFFSEASGVLSINSILSSVRDNPLADINPEIIKLGLNQKLALKAGNKESAITRIKNKDRNEQILLNFAIQKLKIKLDHTGKTLADAFLRQEMGHGVNYSKSTLIKKFQTLKQLALEQLLNN